MQPVHPGAGRRRDILTAFHVHDFALAPLREAAPGACILFEGRHTTAEEELLRRYQHVGPGGVPPVDALVHSAEAFAGPFMGGRVILLGVGLGADAVLSLLAADTPRRPDGVVLVDPVFSEGRDTTPVAAFAGEASAGKRALVVAVRAKKTGRQIVGRAATASKLLVEMGNDHDAIAVERVVAPRALALVLEQLASLPRGDDEGRKLTGSGFGERALAQAEAEFATGANAARISAYFAGVVVGGLWQGPTLHGEERWGLATGPWDAAAIGFCDLAAAEDGDRLPPHRSTAWERIWDARAMGAWRSRRDAGDYVPMPGDACLLKTEHGDPEQRGMGRISRVRTKPEDGVFETIEADVSGKWAVVKRSLRGSTVRGFISYGALAK